MIKINKNNHGNSIIIESDDCADYADKVVRRAIMAKSPLELAEVFQGNPYLNGKMFNRALDLNEKEMYTSKEQKKIQSDVYILSCLNYAKQNKLGDPKKIDKFVKISFGNIWDIQEDK